MSLVSLVLGLSACEEDAKLEVEAFPVPERPSAHYITDQTEIAGRMLALWYEDTACKLEIKRQGKPIGDKQGLQATAPCYFIKSPGSDRVQVYQHDKNTRVVAVVGTPVKTKQPDKQCGQALQGIVIDGGDIRITRNVRRGSVYCVDSGLDNFQYSLFAQP